MRKFTSLFVCSLLCMVANTAWALNQTDGVYQIGTADELIEFATIVNNGEATAKAVLTSDINLSGKTWTLITNTFTGTFDGQGHKISNLTVVNSGSNAGLFTATGAGVVLKNFWLDETCSISGKQAGGIVGNHSGANAQFINVGNAGTVTGTDNTGGLIGGCWAGSQTVTFTQCWTVGEITNTKNSNIAAFCGWCNTGTFNFTDCWTVATLNKYETASKYLARYGGTLNFTNCWANDGIQADGGNFITASDVSSGRLCYLLNGSTSTGCTYFQTIGTDARPLADDTHGTVYRTGTERCDGADDTGTVYSNTSGSISAGSHTYSATTGFCDNCGEANPDFKSLVDGAYELGTATDLLWYASIVRQGQYTASARLTADIDMTGQAWTPIADVDGSPYQATFDGQSHTISGLTMTASSIYGHAGLFGNVAQGTIIKDLTIAGSFVGDTQTAAFVSLAQSTGSGTLTIQNCTSQATVKGTGYATAPFVAKAVCTADARLTLSLSDCKNEAQVSGTAQVGGLVGRVEGCIVSIAGSENNGTVNGTASHVAGFVGSSAAVGDVQTLTITDSKNTASITGGTTSVGGFLGAVSMANELTDCSNTGNIQGRACVGGICGNNSANLTRCSNSGTITGTGEGGELKIGGLMGNAGSSDFTLTDCFNTGSVKGLPGTIASGSKYANGNAGGLVGTTAKNFVIIGCYNTGDVTGFGNNCGGLVGDSSSNTSMEVRNSWNSGAVSSGEITEYTNELNVGGLIGRSTGGNAVRTVVNCYNTGSVTGYGGGTNNVGGIAAWLATGTTLTVQNCWSIGECTAITSGTKRLRLYRNGTFTTSNVSNNYEAYADNSLPTGVTRVSSDEVADGKLCYLLNQGGTMEWYQTIGTDDYPVLDASKGRVNRITSVGYATQYIDDTDVAIPAGVTAYTGEVDGDILRLTAIENKIPAATAVVLKGEAGYYSFVPTTGAAAVGTNDLKGSTVAVTDLDGYSYYVLLKPSDAAVGFYQVTDIVPAGKAYLQLPSGAGVKGFTFGTATSLTPTLSEEVEAPVIYDLSGRRVERATKGIYIVNGKKVLK